MAVEHVAVAHEVRDRLVDILGSKGVGPQQSRLDLASATTLDWALRRTFATAYASTMGTMLAVVAVCGALALLLPTRHRVRTALAQRAGALVHSRTTVVASVAAVGLVVLVLFLVAGGSTPPVVGATIPGDEATIYSSLPLASTSARDVLGAERLALHEASHRAGRLRIRLIARNDADPHSGRWSRDATARNATAAAHDPHTVAYLGEYDSGASAVAVPVLNRAGILTVSPASTAVGLTRSDPGDPGSPGKYAPTGRRTFARVVQNDDAQGQALLTLLRQQGVRRVFVIHGAGRYGSGLARALEGYKSREGVSIVRDRVDAPVPRLVAGVRASDAQAVVFASADTHHAAELFKALHAAEPQVKLFAPDGLVGRRFAHGLGAAAASVFLTAPGVEPNRYPPAGRAFFAAFERRYHRRPDPHAIYGYEAMLATLQAIARSRPTRGGRVSRAAVVNAFFRIKDRPSPIGVYSIDGAGDTTLPYYGGYVVQRGRLVDGP
jgi:branched-chain amino acid transport system substrate-binding protein